MRTVLLTTLLALIMLPGAFAGELVGVSMPDTTQVGDEELQLNGMGLRKKAFIKVYVAGLYLPAKQTDPQKILGADSARKLVMNFKYDVSASKLCGGWDEGLENNTPGAGQAVKDDFATLCEYMEDMEKGEVISFTYQPGTGTEVTVKGTDKGTIEGKDFADGLFACWLGDEPPSEDFKEGLLGG